MAKEEQIEVVERLADSYAHAMNNVLTTVMGLASVLQAELEAGTVLRDDVDAILAASKRGLALTRSLLGFSRRGREGAHEHVSFNRLIGVVRGLLADELGPEVSVALRLDEGLAAVEGDAQQLKNVLIHLAVNALDAVGKAGTLTFVTRNVDADDRQLAVFSNLPPGEFVLVQVSDTGPGMSDEVLTHAAEPFFSTKRRPERTGLGLPFVFGTIRRHGGDVSIFSKEGLGTTVSFCVPAAARERLRQPTPGFDLREVEGTVLVADDEELVLGSTRRMLELLGYRVVVARNGVQALERARELGDDLDLALVDLIMPEMDGVELLEQLHQVRPGLPVMIASGHSKEDMVGRLTRRGAAGFIHKPFSLQKLNSALREVLGGSGS